MPKQQSEIPEIRTEISVKLDLSEDFICMCELMNITYNQALETYLNHIKMYNCLFNESKGINFEATAIFKKFKESLHKIHGIQVAKYHNLHVTPVKEILKLGIAKKGSTSSEYKDVIEKWYKKISKAK